MHDHRPDDARRGPQSWYDIRRAAGFPTDDRRRKKQPALPGGLGGRAKARCVVRIAVRPVLGVEPQQVVLRWAESAEGCFIIDSGMRPVSVVLVQPAEQLSFSLL